MKNSPSILIAGCVKGDEAIPTAAKASLGPNVGKGSWE